MFGQDVVVGYVKACATSMLPTSECGPVWQLGIMGGLLLLAVLCLVVLRVRARMKSATPG